MNERCASLLAPCRIGWLLVACALTLYSIATHQWSLLLAILAPLSGLLLGSVINGRTSRCDVRLTSGGTRPVDE
ncbi:hypothetical protein OO015_04165 [Thermomicrobium sp. 4228-Ro]|uniref:hypothetical protein n=1 Tax=Thermomicrobium sp. 4228-Ro TaxID=2993937 RepID=UPI0022496F37|nr:hypothetical protein [Thermomicrobium sp. 4228-Ro]MCX2726687.1 hypothetical protein [Thermomicrobium sp. 4228-Ro]